MMFGYRINTNRYGVPYVRTTGVTVGTEAVDFALGFRPIDPIGDITINIANEIPEGTTGRSLSGSPLMGRPGLLRSSAALP